MNYQFAMILLFLNHALEEQNLVNSIVSWIKSIIGSHFLQRNQKKRRELTLRFKQNFLITHRNCKAKNFWCCATACKRIKEMRREKVKRKGLEGLKKKKKKTTKIQKLLYTLGYIPVNFCLNFKCMNLKVWTGDRNFYL